MARSLGSYMAAMNQWRRYQRVKYWKNQHRQKNQRKLKPQQTKSILIHETSANLENQHSSLAMAITQMKGPCHTLPLQATQERNLYAVVTICTRNLVHTKKKGPPYPSDYNNDQRADPDLDKQSYPRREFRDQNEEYRRPDIKGERNREDNIRPAREAKQDCLLWHNYCLITMI